jgi:serine protease Do
VIGINTAIASTSRGYQGIGFALPINTAVHVYNDIIKSGKVTRGSIGITYNGDPAQANALLKANGVSDGVFVQSVAPGGPSDKAGLKEADVIVAVNGKPVRNGSELVNIVSTTSVGTALNLTVARDGKRENFKVVVGDLSQIFPQRFGGGNEPEPSKSEATTVSFGMSLLNLTDRQRDNLGIKEKGGVQIVEVEPNSFAEDIGLQQGDVLTQINRHTVNSTDDVKRIQSSLKPGDPVSFRVLSKGARNGDWTPRYVAGTLPSHQ